MDRASTRPSHHSEDSVPPETAPSHVFVSCLPFHRLGLVTEASAQVQEGVLASFASQGLCPCSVTIHPFAQRGHHGSSHSSHKSVYSEGQATAV